MKTIKIIFLSFLVLFLGACESEKSRQAAEADAAKAASDKYKAEAAAAEAELDAAIDAIPNEDGYWNFSDEPAPSADEVLNGPKTTKKLEAK